MNKIKHTQVYVILFTNGRIVVEVDRFYVYTVSSGHGVRPLRIVAVRTIGRLISFHDYLIFGACPAWRRDYLLIYLYIVY